VLGNTTGSSHIAGAKSNPTAGGEFPVKVCNISKITRGRFCAVDAEGHERILLAREQKPRIGNRWM